MKKNLVDPSRRELLRRGVFLSTLLAMLALAGCVISPRRTANGATGTGGGTNTEFTLSADPNPQAVTLGGTAVFTVNVVAESGFTGTVDLVINSAPSSVSASLSGSSIVGGTGSVSLLVQTFPTSALGDDTLTLTGTDPSNGQSQTITVTLTITAA